MVYDDTSKGETVARPFNFHLKKKTGQIKEMLGKDFNYNSHNRSSDLYFKQIQYCANPT